MKNFNNINLKKISNYDLINKYNIKNFYLIPNIEKINFKIHFNDFISSSDNINLINKKNITLKKKLYIILFFFTGNNPLIKNNMTKEIKSKLNSEEIFFETIITKKFINEFLFVLFIENLNKINYTIELKQTKISQNKTIIKFVIPIEYLYEFSFLIKSHLLFSNLKENKLIIFFTIKHNSFFNISSKNIKNLPLFWYNTSI
jgi:hypothetical protein